MRLKITRALSGSIEAIQLSQFVVGRTYDVGTPVGTFLVAVGAAVLIPAIREDDEGERALVGVRHRNQPSHG